MASAFSGDALEYYVPGLSSGLPFPGLLVFAWKVLMHISFFLLAHKSNECPARAGAVHGVFLREFGEFAFKVAKLQAFFRHIHIVPEKIQLFMG
jgi:hypothetical protein